MSDRINRVTLVLDPDYGERVERLAAVSHVWILDTPQNRMAASKYWTLNPQPGVERGVTTFKSSADESPLESCLNLLSAIDLHHGEDSSSPPYSVLEIIGLPLTDEVKSAVEDLGFRRLEPTVKGLIARR